MASKSPLILWPAVLGLLYALTFAPNPLPAWSLAWVQLLTLAGLVYFAGAGVNIRHSALVGLAFGFTSFFVGLYWLTISMHVYGQLALPLAWLALALFSLYLALYPALACTLYAWLRDKRPVPSPKTILWNSTLWAAAWSGSELLRGLIFTGFPWLATAYGQTDSYLAGWGVLMGAPGTTFLTAWVGAAIALTLAAESKMRDSVFTPKRGMALALAIVIAFMGAMLGQSSFTTPAGDPITVRLIQGNVDQGMKFDATRFMQAHDHHLSLARHTTEKTSVTKPQPVELILLPETVIARLSHRIPLSHWQDWIALARQQHATVVLGVAIYDAKNRRYTNSVLAIDANSDPDALRRGMASGRYDKQHLVPFGEYVPWGFRWFIDLMQIPLGDFDRGVTSQELLNVGSQRLSANICYEDIFGSELLPGVRAGATILANFSNLGWFGNSWALRQHWQMARFRAMETRRPMLRATNTGITGAINPSGGVIAMLPAMSAGYVDVQIQGRAGLTPYARWGDTPLVIIVCGILIMSLYRLRRQKALCNA